MVSKNDKSSKEQTSAEWRAIKSLLPYLWPKGQLEMRVRVIVAVILLVAAKVATVAVPAVFGLAVDVIARPADYGLYLPILLLVGYGLLRVGQQAFAELRDFVFAKVGQRAL